MFRRFWKRFSLVGFLPSNQGCPSGLSTVRSDTDDGRLQLPLGSSPRRQPLFGKEDSPGVPVSCKYPRTDGSPQSDSPPLGESPGRSPAGSDRQHHRPVLPELVGGTRSQSLNQLAREITLWCLDRSITIQAVHLSGADNVEADTLSRRPSSRQVKLDSSVEWSLDQETAILLFQVWGSPAADLYTTAANAKVPVFYSRTA